MRNFPKILNQVGTWLPSARLVGPSNLRKAPRFLPTARCTIALRFSKASRKSARVCSRSASAMSTPKSTRLTMPTEPVLESRQCSQCTAMDVTKDPCQGQRLICRFSKCTSLTTATCPWAQLTCHSTCACPLTQGRSTSTTTTRHPNFPRSFVSPLPSQGLIRRPLKNNGRRQAKFKSQNGRNSRVRASDMNMRRRTRRLLGGLRRAIIKKLNSPVM